MLSPDWSAYEKTENVYLYDDNMAYDLGKRWRLFLILAPKQRSILNLLFRFCNLYDVPQVDAGGDQQRRAIRASWDLGIS